MKKIGLSTILASVFFAHSTLAHNITLNSGLAPVAVTKDGELILSNGDVNYQSWRSANLVGKVRVIQHIVGRSSVKEKNEALMDAIKAEKFDGTKYQTTTIINADDAIIGTGTFVKSSAEKGKKQNSHSQVILDQQSSVKNAWALKEKESLIVVLDKSGKVKFVKEGKLTPQEIQSVIALVKSLL